MIIKGLHLMYLQGLVRPVQDKLRNNFAETIIIKTEDFFHTKNIAIIITSAILPLVKQ